MPPNLLGNYSTRLIVALGFVAVASILPLTRSAQEALTLSVRIVDAGLDEPTPARVKVTDLHGRATTLPDQAIAVMYGMWDHADGYGYQPDSSFYVDGYFELVVDPGEYVVRITKGIEFEEVLDTLRLSRDTSLEYRLERWIDTAAMGWYSADDHIHIRRSPREDPLLIDWIRAEDIRVGNTLRMGDFWAKYYSQYAFGEAGAYIDDGHMLVSGQEDPRTPEIGHVIGLGASAFVRFPDQYYLYDLVLDSLRTLGGVGGYAHQAETFHGYRGLVLDGLRGKVDVLEVVQFCAPGGPLITDHFYHLLNLGFPVTATAGSDFPWCGLPHDGSGDIPVHENAQIGNARFYAQVEGDLDYASWKEALKAGRTVASSGPVLILDVDGEGPGSQIDLSRRDPVRVTATAYGHRDQVRLESVEIVVHGRVIASASSGDPGQTVERIEVDTALVVQNGIWIAARARAGPMQAAHTTPVYVTVDGGGFYDPASLDSLLDRSSTYLHDLEHVLHEPHTHVEYQAWRHRDGLMERIEETRAVIERMRSRN